MLAAGVHGLALIASAVAGMVEVPGGTYRPLYPVSPAETTIVVAPFAIDVTPVTNANFLRFVQAQPKWQRARVSRLYADASYLAHWQGDTVLGPRAHPQAPVVHVSWFAAKAYCELQGARLPYEREWEFVAAADEELPTGMLRAAKQEVILGWYARPNAALGPVGAGRANVFGVHDMHGLVWEWIYDYAAALVSEDSREQGGAEKARFCGAGAAKATDPAQYGTFMRMAFRSSLEAKFGTANLGFRCARSRRPSRVNS